MDNGVLSLTWKIKKLNHLSEVLNFSIMNSVCRNGLITLSWASRLSQTKRQKLWAAGTSGRPRLPTDRTANRLTLMEAACRHGWESRAPLCQRGARAVRKKCRLMGGWRYCLKKCSRSMVILPLWSKYNHEKQPSSITEVIFIVYSLQITFSEMLKQLVLLRFSQILSH